MAIESLVALAAVTVFLAGVAWYATSHRSEDTNKHRHHGNRA